MKKSKGFTLIELLVVISIIGVIASIVLVSFSGQSNKAKIARSQQFSSQINHALGAYAVGIWDFEDQNNPTADRSGYGNDGTLYDNTHFVVNNVLGGYALSFDGSGDYIDCGNNSSLNITDSLTIEAWVKAPAATVGTIVMWGEISTGKRRSLFLWNGDSGNGRLYWSGYGAAANIDSGIRIDDNNWHHCVVTKNSSDFAITYVDGVAGGSGSVTLISYTFTGTHIGENVDGTERFNGTIDDVRIYSEALSASQIQQHYALGATKHGITLNQ